MKVLAKRTALNKLREISLKKNLLKRKNLKIKLSKKKR